MWGGSTIELLFLLIIGGVVLVFGRRSNRYKKFRRKKTRASFKPETIKPKPFDAESAERISETIVLRGRARIVDGDTLVIQKVQVRLFGVDAPEITHPYGQKAKWALVSICKGQVVEATVTETDDHGRTVAKCYLADGRDISAEMVKLGLAIDWPKFSGGVYKLLETPDARKKLWLADARQKGRMHVWKQFEARQRMRNSKDGS